MRPKSFSLDLTGPTRTIIPVSAMAGDQVEVTTHNDGHGGWVTHAVRQYRTSTDGVILFTEESEPVLVLNSPPHGNEMNLVSAHAHAVEHLSACVAVEPDFRGLFAQGRTGAPDEVRELERVDHLAFQESFDLEESLQWDDEL